MPSLLFREIAALETLETSLHGAGSLAEALQSIVDSVAHLTGADRATLIVMDSSERRIRHFVRGGAGWPEVMTTVSFEELTSGLTGWSLNTGEVALSPKGVPDPRESEEVQLRRVQTHCGAILVAPLGPDGDRHGTITLINRPDQPDFTADDADSLRLFAQFTTGTVRLHAAREQVAKARAEAEEALRSKTGFLSNLSHELRTPLNGILGFSHLLETSSLDASQRAMVDTIVESGERLLGTIDNILELAQFEAGQFRLENAPFSPQAVFEGLLEPFHTAAVGKGLAWQTTVGTELPLVVDGDAIRLRQAWSHLLSNAVKFTAEGSVTVRLESRKIDSLRLELALTVEDTGIGLSKERSGPGFSPFHQEDGSLTRRFGGTGLGLALCDRIVRAMGGGLALGNALGGGTRAKAWVEVGIEGYPALSAPSGLRILLQEPDPGNRLVMVKLLEQEGHRVDVVSTRPQACERLASDHYEVVMVKAFRPDSEDSDGLHREALRKNVHVVELLRPGSDPPRTLTPPCVATLSTPPEGDALRSVLERCLVRDRP